MADKNPKRETEKMEDDDYVVFIPDEDMWAIDRAFFKMERARQELHKIRDEMNAANNKEATSDET
ncbi:MAG: hypothetical protein LBH77_09815 [Tannerella sp.]|jgi:uncharacterized protein YneR|nr:hypothetical protein [Tannerella sp.]